MDVDESAGKGATRKPLPVPGLERTSLNSVLRARDHDLARSPIPGVDTTRTNKSVC